MTPNHWYIDIRHRKVPCLSHKGIGPHYIQCCDTKYPKKNTEPQNIDGASHYLLNRQFFSGPVSCTTAVWIGQSGFSNGKMLFTILTGCTLIVTRWKLLGKSLSARHWWVSLTSLQPLMENVDVNYHQTNSVKDITHRPSHICP